MGGTSICAFNLERFPFNNRHIRKAFSLGIDRDFIGDGGANTGDYMEFGDFTARTTKNDLRGVFFNEYGFGFTDLDGFGLINAVETMNHVSPAP